jgi:pterin-4a-carbinolamine dehydratase
MAKQMEGDNQKRRALARAARERGRSASAAGVTLGASKQPEHAERKEREGPPPAGAHKPGPRAPRPERRPEPEPSWPARLPPIGDEAPDTGALRLRYRELVDAVAARVGLPFDRAKEAARATVAVLARALAADGRRRLLDALPAELSVGQDVTSAYRGAGPADFVREVAALSGLPPEQARLRVQAVFAAIGEQDDGLLPSLDLPPGHDELIEPPPVGGGVVGPDGHTAPLDEEELRAALRRLPDWTGDRTALIRTLILPADQLDLMLHRLARLKQEVGRSPRISRPDQQTAVLVLQTTNAGAVTALDVDLAGRIDAVLAERGSLA